MKIYICEICNAENEIEAGSGDEIQRCENCDNDLIRQKPKVRIGGNPYLLEMTLNSILAKVYLVVFGGALTLYFLSHIGVTPNLDSYGIDFPLLYIILHVPALLHMGIIKYVDIEGVYRGTQRYYMERIMILIALVTLLFIEMFADNFETGLSRTLYIMVMVISYILFNTHYFGRKGISIFR